MMRSLRTLSTPLHPNPAQKQKASNRRRGEWKTAYLEGGALSILSWKGTASRIEVPALLRKRMVREIEEEDFSPAKTKILMEGIEAGRNITEVSVPEGIRTKEDGAFSQCRKLTTVHLPSTLLEIGEKAFFLTNLEELVIPASIRRGAARFVSGCFSLKRVVLESVTTKLADLKEGPWANRCELVLGLARAGIVSDA